MTEKPPAMARSLRGRATAVVVALLALAAAADSVRAAKLEAVFVVLGPQGAIARAVIADARGCPAITIDGTPQAMNVRASPDAAFPVLVCELPIASGTKSATIENSELPRAKAELRSIAAFGDTGCRLKAAKRSAGRASDIDADEDRGKFQDCNVPSAWPFAQVVASIAAAKPDLIIH